jgi:Protein of unknown function (DUF3987)
LGGQARRRHLPGSALLHLASHLRDGWAQPIGAETFAGALRLADYLIDHACAVFDLMGADPRIDDARWLLDWITRTNQAQFSRRDAHQAARGRFRKATDLEPALALLEEHGYLRRVDADPPGPKGGRLPSPRFLVNPVPHNSEPSQPTKPHPPTGSVGSVGLSFVATPQEAPDEGTSARRQEAQGRGLDRPIGSLPAVTLSNEDALSRSRAGRQSPPKADGRQWPVLVRPDSHHRRHSYRSSGL